MKMKENVRVRESVCQSDVFVLQFFIIFIAQNTQITQIFD